MAALISASVLPAATYYVDAAQGSDANNGRNVNAPWRSLSRIAASGFNPGDYVLLKRGSVWREQMLIQATGEADRPVVFGAYGTGPRPLIDGTGILLPAGSGMIDISQSEHVVLSGVDVKASSQAGINIYASTGIRLRDFSSTANYQDGVLVYNSEGIEVEDCTLSGNSVSRSGIRAGISIDGTGGVWTGFRIRGCVIADNAGGSDWERAANGIYLGHTGGNIPTLLSVEISGNDINANGDRTQNQHGRGISASCHGSLAIRGNRIRNSASAGVYLGDAGLRLDAVIENNSFEDNALRQFGGLGDGKVEARRNLILVKSERETAMGVEVGGTGSWLIEDNVFFYTEPTTNPWRSHIRLFDPAQDTLFKANANLYYSAGPNRWRRSDGQVLTCSQWRAAGFDMDSYCPQ